ncbi:MAG: hypothetical protein P1U63_13405 [Coxiellaceae bacterium]|nr:hypothetical protein [Coxiellaceae bacterium]
MRSCLTKSDLAVLAAVEGASVALESFLAAPTVYQQFDALAELIKHCDESLKDIKQRAMLIAMCMANSVDEIHLESQCKLRAFMRKHSPDYMPWIKPFRPTDSKKYVSDRLLFLPEPQAVLDCDEGVTQLNKHEREFHRVIIWQGLFYTLHKTTDGIQLSLFDTASFTSHGTSHGEALFVISPAGDFFVGSTENCKFYHSSLMASEPVFYAGTLKVKEGKMTFLGGRSGHYLPWNKHTYRLLAYLRRCDVLESSPDLSLLREKYEFVPDSRGEEGHIEISVEMDRVRIRTTAELAAIYCAPSLS